MSAISRKHMTVLRQGITLLRERHLSLHNLGFTHAEFLELFAPPEHWEILNTASEVASVDADGGNHWATFDHKDLIEPVGTRVVGIRFTVCPVGGRAPLLPRNRNVLHVSAPLTQKITSWVTERVKLGYDYALATALLEWMNDKCDSPKQIRYLWPSLVALCALSDETKDLGHKLRDTKPPQSLPAMPIEVRDACRETSRSIAIASLIGAEPIETFSAPVVAVINEVKVIRSVGALGNIAPV
jgi:hypothetical protein